MNLTNDLDHILPLVKKPGRYIGGELNACVKNWNDTDIRFVPAEQELHVLSLHFSSGTGANGLRSNLGRTAIAQTTRAHREDP